MGSRTTLDNVVRRKILTVSGMEFQSVYPAIYPVASCYTDFNILALTWRGKGGKAISATDHGDP
jgi:hypothetical protein